MSGKSPTAAPEETRPREEESHHEDNTALPPPPPREPTDTHDTREDQKCFVRTVEAFRQYFDTAMSTNIHRRQDFEAMSPKHKLLLGIDFGHAIFDRHVRGIFSNASLLNSICDVSHSLFEAYWPGVAEPVSHEPPTSIDIDKVFSTLRQFVRDWSDVGKSERESVYGPIRTALLQRYPDPNSRRGVNVLVPGAGLSRLSFELAYIGFNSQGNEFSYHMLIAGHFILNHVEVPRRYEIFPFVDTTVNLFRREDQFQPVLIPDASTLEMIAGLEEEGHEFGGFSMVAGDFTEVYARPKELSSWDVVVTCFFIDTAHNVIQYVETIYNALKPGGLWINVGPLLYHFAENLSDPSIELAFDEIMGVAGNIGFQFVGSPAMIETTYACNRNSMKQVLYRCVMTIAEKPRTMTTEVGQ